MTVAMGKKRVQVTLGADVLAQLDVLAARRHQHRGHLIEAVLRRFLSRDLEDALPPPPPDPRQIDLEDVLASPR